MRKSNFKPTKKDINSKEGYPIYWIEEKLRHETQVTMIAITSFTKTNEGWYCGYKGISQNAGTGGTVLIPFDLDKKPFGIKNVIYTGRRYKQPYRWYPKPGMTAYDLMC